MAARIIELKGSGDFTRGPSGTEGRGLAIVLGATGQTEAEELAREFFPDVVAGIPRGSVRAFDQGGDVYGIEVEYRSAVPTENAATAGDPPESARPESPAGGKSNTDRLSRDMTFSAGGGTRKRMYSIKTRHAIAAAGGNAPNFGGLIGVTKDGKVEGCEVIAPMSDFTITKRFPYLTLGWFRTMLDLVACTNDGDWLGMYRGEVLFKGCDGNYKDGDAAPWSVTGKFGYSRNYVYDETEPGNPDNDVLTIGDLIIPDIYGWEYLWVSYKGKTQTIATPGGGSLTVSIEVPNWAYVEQVYHEGHLSDLGLDQ